MCPICWISGFIAVLFGGSFIVVVNHPISWIIGFALIIYSIFKFYEAKKRGKKMKVAATYVNIKNKEKELEKICKIFDVKRNEIAYIGDDLNDYNIIKLVGFSATPANGINQLKEIVNFISKINGGDGVFREVADMILFAKNIKTNL